MRKACIVLLVAALLSFAAAALAASVTPVEMPGNDSNPSDFTPPAGCLHYEIPNSGNEGSHTARFDADGNPDPAGPFFITVVVGKAGANEYTEVLSWASNFPIGSVIVKGGNAFHVYSYATGVRGDTSLVAPNTASEQPADVSHVSVVVCPEDFPPPPTPSPTVTPAVTPTATPVATTPPGSCPPSTLIIFVVLIVAAFLIGLALGFALCAMRKGRCCC